MTNATLSFSQPARRFDIRRVFRFFRHPWQEMKQLAEENTSLWVLPMLVLSAALLLQVFASGFLQARAAAGGEIPLPPDWQWWTPEMQNKYMQTIQATQSPTFVYVIPAVVGLIKLWLGWLVLSGLFHLFSTILGGRGNLSAAMNVVAWSSLPFALRDLLRVIFMLIVRHPLSSPGLSGFAAGTFVGHILANVDLFLLWQALLLIAGFKFSDGLSQGKSVLMVMLILLLALLVQAGLAAVGAGFSGMMITRPFF